MNTETINSFCCVGENDMLKSKAITPLYEQLMEQLKKQIASGVYKPGDQLPSEIEMAKQNNVSVITARKAMNELAALGFVEKAGERYFCCGSKILA